MKKNKEQGKRGEDALQKWFSDSNLAYVSICQSPDTFAQLFKGKIKRPDFLLLIQSIGLIAIDAKNQTYYEKYDNYTLSYDDELRRALMFESLFRIPLWYAYYHEDEKQWYWISSLKALEKGELRQQKDNTDKSFLAIKRENFIIIENAEDLSKLYTHFIDDLENVSNRMHDSNKQKFTSIKSKSNTVTPLKEHPPINQEASKTFDATSQNSHQVLQNEKPSFTKIIQSIKSWF